MAHDNNLTIGSVGTGNTIHIDQRRGSPPESPHIEYKIAQDSIQHLSRSEVNKSALSFYGAIALPFLALVADSLGILSFIGVQTKWTLVAILPIVLAITLATMQNKEIAKTTFRPNVANFLHGKWVERENDGNYIIYQKTAPCIHRGCRGTVFIRRAPPREQPNHTLVGVCDTGGHRHTYTVDFNGIGYPEQFDWRPIESQKE